MRACPGGCHSWLGIFAQLSLRAPLDHALRGAHPLPRFDRLEFDQPGERPEHGQAADREPLRDAEHWLKLAGDNRRRGLYEDALRYFSRALEQDRSLVEGWLGQVQMLI